MIKTLWDAIKYVEDNVGKTTKGVKNGEPVTIEISAISGLVNILINDIPATLLDLMNIEEDIKNDV